MYRFIDYNSEIHHEKILDDDYEFNDYFDEIEKDDVWQVNSGGHSWNNKPFINYLFDR